MKLRSLLLVSLILGLIPLNAPATAQSIDNCRIAAARNSIVSLGFPVRPERLAFKANPKILVLPFQLKDEPKYTLTDQDRANFDQAAVNILEFSQGINKVNFVFNPTVELSYTASEFDDFKINVSKTFQNNFKNSTYGLVESIIKSADQSINYEGFDAVVIFGSSSYRRQEIAEAMMFTKDKLAFGYGVKTGGNGSNWWNPTIVNDNWFDPIVTNEGLISNVTLMYNAMNPSTLTHELMHLYGLTDLYGSNSSPANTLMSDNAIALLALEKWTLGWLADENVQCISEKVDIKADSVNNAFSVDYSSKDQLIVIPTGPTTALGVDVTKRGSRRLLSFYSLDNDIRPSITAFRSNSKALSIDVSNNSGTGSFIESPKYTLLIKDNIGLKLSLSLIPKDLANSDAAKQLFTDAENTRISNVKLIQAENEAKAAAELKAKQEAEAKAIADAKVVAEAKAAADLKAKQEAEAKAAAAKKTTITCIKGKLTKKVTAVKPKCPTGYKLKK
jgi:M6 family metalloprotease-like protein